MRFAAALIALGVAARLLTWDPIAHGDRARHVKVTLVGGAAAVAVAAVARRQLGPRSRAPLLWSCAVLLAADVPHYARFAHPIARGGSLVAVAVDLRDRTSVPPELEVVTSGAGSARVAAGALTLESPAGSTAYVTARVPAPPDAQRNWLLPVGLLERERRERVEWRGAIRRTGAFFVIAELRRLLLQSVGAGLHVTYPDERDQMRGFEVALSAVGDGNYHDWVVERSPSHVAVTVDGQRVWSAAPREPITQVRLGESRSDPQHGGTLALERASYAVSLVRS